MADPVILIIDDKDFLTRGNNSLVDDGSSSFILNYAYFYNGSMSVPQQAYAAEVVPMYQLTFLRAAQRSGAPYARPPLARLPPALETLPICLTTSLPHSWLPKLTPAPTIVSAAPRAPRLSRCRWRCAPPSASSAAAAAPRAAAPRSRRSLPPFRSPSGAVMLWVAQSLIALSLALCASLGVVCSRRRAPRRRTALPPFPAPVPLAIRGGDALGRPIAYRAVVGAVRLPRRRLQPPPRPAPPYRAPAVPCPRSARCLFPAQLGVVTYLRLV
ncbi:hypothetical protein C8R47DRAFT_1205572 [Mycena vitilis]|nr:hypothetical protein C8R47DRAFT_1205572 [Mycena vitilis]